MIKMKTEENGLKEDLHFLLTSLRDYLNKMRNSLNSNKFETFFLIYKQFNRSLGELLGITKYGNGIPKTEHDEVIEVTFKELSELMREAHEMEEEFLKRLNKSIQP